MNHDRSPRPRVAATIVLAGAIALAGCETMDERQRGTAQGAAIGAVAGAVIGKATGGKAGTGAVAGAAVGAIAGNLWSKRMQDKQRAMEQATQGTGIEVARTEDNQLKVNVPSDISFAVGRADLQPGLRPVLDQFAQGLDATTVVRIVGHTDSTGNDSVNEPLSTRRAASARDFLVDRGVNAGRIAIAGRGSRQPVASNETASGRARNRRVEIYVGESGG